MKSRAGREEKKKITKAMQYSTDLSRSFAEILSQSFYPTVW